MNDEEDSNSNNTQDIRMAEITEVVEKLVEMQDDLRSLTVIYDVESDDKGVMTGIAGESKPLSEWTFHNAVLNNYINELLKGDEQDGEIQKRLDIH